MATRQEVQIAQDLIRFTNVMNDLLDVVSYLLKDINTDTGMQLEVKDEESYRNTTLEELKAKATSGCRNALGYQVMIDEFLSKASGSVVQNGLTAAGGGTLQDIKDDILAMKNECNYILANVQAPANKESLAVLGEHVDVAIPKLTLVRRTWDL